MKFKFMSIMVHDQDAALQFYTGILGFTRMADIAMGSYRWLTVTSPDGIEGVELVLESMAFPPAHVYQKARFDAGIPSLALISNDIYADYNRLRESGVVFRGEPQSQGIITTAIFEDTCGNLIHLVQPVGI
jgi:catechol 2,3-dioxygenase-like lactoylglutathione lyase family enzyme